METLRDSPSRWQRESWVRDYILSIRSVLTMFATFLATDTHSLGLGSMSSNLSRRQIVYNKSGVECDGKILFSVDDVVGNKDKPY